MMHRTEQLPSPGPHLASQQETEGEGGKGRGATGPRTSLATIAAIVAFRNTWVGIPTRVPGYWVKQPVFLYP
eukprot:1086537-Rhodomonas_salina.1